MKFPVTITGASERYQYRGTTATRAKPWDIEDMDYLKKSIAARSESRENIQSSIRSTRAAAEKRRGDGNIPWIVGRIFSPALAERAEKAFPINEKLRERFDGCRASIGMSVAEVDALYGEPLRVFTTQAGHVARIYGDRHYSGDVEPFLMFSYVAVLFDDAGRAARIFSNGYFCNDWDPDMPPGRRE